MSKGAGMQLQIENYLPGENSMRDLSREANGAAWPSCYNGINLPNDGQFYYGFSPTTIADLHPGYDKDGVKQTMLEHEVVFKDQVCELHRLYRVQRDLMDEVRRKEQFQRHVPYETSSSSSTLPAKKKVEDAQRGNGSNFSMASQLSGRPRISGPVTILSSPNSEKGKSVRAGPSTYQNYYSPKNSEVSESRPTKLRKRMFDLQLPADEYIDIDELEQFSTTKDFENRELAYENRKMSIRYAGKTECQGDEPSTGLYFSTLKATKGLADLNEPLNVGEMNTFSYGDFRGRAASQSDVSNRDHSTRSLNLSKDIPQNFMKNGMNGVDNVQEVRAIGQDWFSYASESEHFKASVRCTNHGIHPGKLPPVSSQPVHLLDQACQPQNLPTSDHFKGEPWKANSIGLMENSLSSYNIVEPSHPGLAYPNLLSNNPVSFHTIPFHSRVNLGKSPQSSTFTNDINKWNLNNTPAADNGAFVCDLPVRHGFYHNSSAALKEPTACFPPAGFGYVKYSSEMTVSCNGNANPVKEMNLNVALSNGVSDEPRENEIIEDRKPKDPFAVLPWLGGNVVASSSRDTDTKATKPEISTKILGVSIFDNPPMSNLENIAVINPHDTHHRSGHEKIESSKRNIFFDMNVPCELIDSDPGKMSEDDFVIVNTKDTKFGTLRNHFDLNSCLTEEEITCETSKASTGIDLEAPLILENDDEDVVLPIQDPSISGDAELVKSAAEAIVAISYCVDNSTRVSTEVTTCPALEACEGDDPLNWFVTIACSSGSNPDFPFVQNDRLSEGPEDFEYTILRLKECTLEEYFPTPSIPDFSIVDNSACALTTRPRRGPGRRGRQKRDFQRDILPGLITLSRHEVTEDLQTFGGLMRATGYSWLSGPNRTRNKCGRGRPRSVVTTPVLSDTVYALPSKQQQQQLRVSNVKAGLEDANLTGWGKTTRRPRRQRCPAGNPALPVPLT